MAETHTKNLGTQINYPQGPITINNNFVNSVAESQTPLSVPKFIPVDFPSRLIYFTGRETVLKNIAIALQTKGRAAIADTHGVGKSSVVNEFAYKNQDSYKHILFIRAAKGEFDISISKLLTGLRIDLPNDAKPEQRLFFFQTWLAENSDWLLLVDNVDDVGEILACNFNKPNGKVIYTANDDRIYKVGSKVDLPKMSNDNAVLLLYKHWKNNADAKFADISEKHHQTLKDIAEKFGNHPFSMEFVGSYLADKDESLGAFLANYQTKEANLLETYSFLSTYQHKEVATAFLLRFKQISTPKDNSVRENFLSVTVIGYLKLSAYIGTDNIPEELLQQCLAKIYPNQSALTDDKAFIKEIYARFKPTSIFKRDSETKTLTTHRIVQEIMRFQIGNEEDLILETLAQILANNFERFEFINQKIVERYLLHVETFLEHLEANRQNDQDILKLKNELTANLCNDYARYFYQYGKYLKAEKYYLYFKNICEAVKDIDQTLLAESYNNLALLYHSQGKYDVAEPLYLKIIEIFEKILGENHPSTAKSYNNLAGLYESQGRYDDAETLYKNALAIWESVFGENHPSTATSYNNLALLYYSQGRYDDAETLNKKALAIREIVLGENHPDTAQSYNNLAVLYRTQVRYKEAEPLSKKVIKIFENVLGENHPSTATSYDNLAELYISQGRYDNAEPLNKKALAIREKVLGENHPSTATSYHNLGVFYSSQRKFAKAKNWLEKALVIRQKVLGNKHPKTIRTQQSLEDVDKMLEEK